MNVNMWTFYMQFYILWKMNSNSNNCNPTTPKMSSWKIFLTVQTQNSQHQSQNCMQTIQIYDPYEKKLFYITKRYENLYKTHTALLKLSASYPFAHNPRSPQTSTLVGSFSILFTQIHMHTHTTWSHDCNWRSCSWVRTVHSACEFTMRPAPDNARIAHNASKWPTRRRNCLH